MIRQRLLVLIAFQMACGISKALWAWTFIHSSWTLWYVSKGILFLLRSHLWSLYSTMLEKSLRQRITALLIFFLWLVVFEKLVNNMLVDHREEVVFSDFQYGFWFPWSTANLLTAGSYRIARLLKVCGYLRCSTWYIQSFRQSLVCWSSSQT